MNEQKKILQITANDAGAVFVDCPQLTFIGMRELVAALDNLRSVLMMNGFDVDTLKMTCVYDAKGTDQGNKTVD